MTGLGTAAIFRRHGGRFTAAANLLPAAPKPWLDLSTGINPHPYPVRQSSIAMRARLPQPEETEALEVAAATAFGIFTRGCVAAVPGSEAALRLLPRLLKGRNVAVAGPSYSSHEDAWHTTDAEVATVSFARIGSADADVLIVVNPNNPDGQTVAPETLLDLAHRQEARNGWLVVDEAFADTTPELSVAAQAGGILVVLRSFGKFYGLPGIRLGFVLADEGVIAGVRAGFGDWPVSADAIVAGRTAYADRAWADRTRRWLERGAKRLDAILARAGLTPVGGTSLFRLARCPDAALHFTRLASAGILTRIFSYDPTLIRFGLPRGRLQWTRLEAALQGSVP